MAVGVSGAEGDAKLCGVASRGVDFTLVARSLTPRFLNPSFAGRNAVADSTT